jgi:membrane-associated protein
VTSLLFAGYFFGSLPWVKDNFEYIVYFIIIISVLPMIIEFIQHKRGPRLSKADMKHANFKDLEETIKKADK